MWCVDVMVSVVCGCDGVVCGCDGVVCDGVVWWM